MDIDVEKLTINDTSTDSISVELVEYTNLVDKILEDNNELSDENIDFSLTNGESNGNGLYYTSDLTRTEGETVTYYFRGNVENNYVKFGKFSKDTNLYIGYSPYYDYKHFPTLADCQSTTDMYNQRCAEIEFWDKYDDIYWRIVRINEDGSIRLIYHGPNIDAMGDRTSLGSYEYNMGVNDDNAYVGYMYGNIASTGDNAYDLTHTNIHESTVKSNILDPWFEENLLEYSKYLADAGFCNDRTKSDTPGAWTSSDTALGYGKNKTYYSPHYRVMIDKKPSFKCSNSSRDLFTLDESNKGNQQLDYPIGLLTVDEAMYAGGGHYSFGHYYLVDNMTIPGNEESAYLFWTISPQNFSSSGASDAWVVGADGRLNGITVNYARLIKPVINLKADVKIVDSKQDGTKNNVYEIKID